ncbi:putative phosphoenolpyruvate synthase-like protein, partial [Dinothrombium tinctorium]
KLKFKVDLIENDSESEKLVINIENWSSRTIAGGKGLSLSQLSFISRETWNTLDFPNFFVPQGVIVTTNAYSLYLKQNPSVEKAIDILQNNVWKSTSEDIKNKCESVINLIKNTQLPTEVKNEILNQLILIFGEEAMNSLKFAVRSSSCSEDSEEMSAAGQMSSFLGIKRIENIYTSVLDCWASQFSYVAVQYKHGYGQLFNTQMAVVIQEMIDCDVAGVLFTCNPVNGDGRRTMITANYGLC